MSATFPSSVTAYGNPPLWDRFLLIADGLLLLAGIVFREPFIFFIGAALLGLSLFKHARYQSKKKLANEATLSELSLTDLLALLSRPGKDGFTGPEIFAALNRHHPGWRKQAEPKMGEPVIIPFDPRYPVIETPSFSGEPIVIPPDRLEAGGFTPPTFEQAPEDHTPAQEVGASVLETSTPADLTYKAPTQTLEELRADLAPPVESALAAALPSSAAPAVVVDTTGGKLDQAFLRQYLLTGGDFLTAAQLGALAGWNDKRPGTRLNKWRRAGALFCIRHKNQDLFPLYALDPANDYQPRPEVANVLKAFEDTKGDWGLAFWFASISSTLGGARPQDVLATRAQEVTAAATDERAGVQHG